MKLYAYSIAAWNSNGGFSHLSGLFGTNNPDFDANTEAIAVAHKMMPKDKGYYDHGVSIIEITLKSPLDVDYNITLNQDDILYDLKKK